MQPVTTVTGTAYPWGAKNIDTDIIIPAHWLKTITRTGLSRGAFETVRAQPGNVFDDPRYSGAPILIAGDNFGCGSSREHAAWALADMGVQAVIAPSFSDIFSGNAFKNGIVPVVLPQEAVDRLVEVAKDQPITVDLETMTVTTPYQDRFVFELDAFRRQCLMQGLDEIGLTMAKDTAISKFEGAVDQHRPWVASRSGYAGIAVNGIGRT
ncbi:3-isopropylmalate dehydratase small subunit [Sphingomonadaceae bacterium OTU29THOMA1]|uniref:3-isopropylmalate dehydratase small subunit n=1 Tax=Sphingomonas sp. Leaf37 TaxID=2876552 RepID=UPI001E5DBB41|nr:3-isopropylmalate dehydratase small subunit [Sphingomonas sp. Leaf37]USU05107.1 3-isopropylmalate dehydratase small subunit [Sphingomonadaceae bacterium OTU29LAMAA1]USU12224.1 3-isopropylmalate dehydratase small subunit [Sphingomonadaceae bacterium OTU29THOMA1]